MMIVDIEGYSSQHLPAPSPWAQWIFHPSLTSAKVLWEILEDSKDPSVFGVEAGFTHHEISEALSNHQLIS